MPINYQAKMSRSIAAIDLQDKGQASKAACPTTSASKARRFYGLCEDEKAVASWSQTAVLSRIVTSTSAESAVKPRCFAVA